MTLHSPYRIKKNIEGGERILIQTEKPTISIALYKASEQDFFEVKHFLKRHKQSSMQSDDSVFIVRLNTASSRTIIGVAKLKQLNQNTHWLHGVYVVLPWRNQGVASQLLQFITEWLPIQHANEQNSQIFAFPLPHLETFYRKIGYRPTAPLTLPQTLQARYQAAQTQQKGWLSMSLTIKNNLI